MSYSGQTRFPGLSNKYGITESARSVYAMFLINVAALVNLYEINWRLVDIDSKDSLGKYQKASVK